MPLPIPKFIKTAFANIGLRNNIPETTNNITGAAGYDRGFGEINMLPEGAGGIPPDGKDFNGIFFDISSAIRYLQSGVEFPFDQDFATAIGGYEIGAIVSDSSDKSLLWINGTASNTAFPSGWTSFKRSDPTETVRGMPLVATSAEVMAGTNDAKTVTPKKLKDAGLWPLGVGQSWQNVTASRTLNVNYTNTTGRSIVVNLVVGGLSAGSVVIVGGDEVCVIDGVTESYGVTASAIVPNGATYSCKTVGGIVARWMELR